MKTVFLFCVLCAACFGQDKPKTPDYVASQGWCKSEDCAKKEIIESKEIFLPGTYKIYCAKDGTLHWTEKEMGDNVVLKYGKKPEKCSDLLLTSTQGMEWVGDHIKVPTPEPKVVPAIKKTYSDETSATCRKSKDETWQACTQVEYTRWACADPSRVLLHSEDGKLHFCLKLETEKQ